MKRGRKPLAPAERRRRRKAAVRRAMKKYHAKKRRAQLEKIRTPTARALLPAVSIEEALDAGLSISKHQHAALYWMDKNGRLHRDDHRSATQLIEAFQKGDPRRPHLRTPEKT